MWDDSIRMLSTISESIFSRTAHFILELLQNAEDAGIKSGSRAGEIEFLISRARLKVSHNGAPFTEDDVNAICGVRSKKKPEEGTLGFLGIGFKSVFKVTSCPQVYSGQFRFRFDKGHWKTHGAEPWPWQIAPLWVEQPREPIDPALTTFILPFLSDEAYQQTRSELSKLDVHIFLFLKWLRRLRVCDEGTGELMLIENLGGQGRIVSLRKDSVTHRFVIFRRVTGVPPEVARDPALEFYKRQGVKEREIVLAFGLGARDELTPIVDASTLGSVSSFLPLTEERSGAKFLIQSDFLVQPGREAIQYELGWNQWLVSEAAEVAKEAVVAFKRHRKWGTHFLALFDFEAYWGQAGFDRLFYPRLHAPLMGFLEAGEVYPTAAGGYVKPGKAVHAKEGLAGLLTDSDLGRLFPGETGLRLVNPDLDVERVPVGLRHQTKTVSLGQVARNKLLLVQKLRQQNHVQWFSKLYKAMEESGEYFMREEGRTPRGRIQWYDSPVYILTDQEKVAAANTVYLRDIPKEVIQLRRKFREVDVLLASYQLVHPRLATPQLAQFFEERTHVESIDYEKICRTVFLPKLEVAVQAPPKDELIAYTRLLQKGPGLWEPIWVLTKPGGVKPSNQVFFSSGYSPAEDWERNAVYVPHMDFLSDEYLQGVARTERPAWKDFFASVGVKERAESPHVEQFAMAFVEDKLSVEVRNFVSKNRQQHGYDREGTRVADGSRIFLEIKGQKAEHPIELVGNEPLAARQAKQNNVPFWVCVVPGIPENAKLWVVEDALAAGQFDVVTIDVGSWKGHGRRVV